MSVDTHEIDRLILRVKGLRFQLQNPAGLMRTVAQGVETQTRHRIHNEKTAPDGRRWRPWSKAYAKTRGPQHSLLIDTRKMVDGIDSRSGSRTAEIFSKRPYAGKHQRERPFLGLSRENASDISAWLAGAVLDMTREALGGR